MLSRSISATTFSMFSSVIFRRISVK
jgi:hypothetical protein